MRRVLRPALPTLALTLVLTRPAPAQQADIDSVMAGISNHGHDLDQPYVTAGDRAYLIGTQDGDFPDLGRHVPGEMGGLWLHPVKLLDGFWATITDLDTGREAALSTSTELVTYPYGSRFRYRPLLDGLEVERFQFSPDGHDGVVVQYVFRNPTDRGRRLRFLFSARTELSPVWLSERLGLKDARDVVEWEPTEQVFVARDSANPWFAIWGAVRRAEGERVPNPPPARTRGPGITAASRYSVSVEPRATSTLTFVLAGSPTGRAEALRAYRRLADQHGQLLERKQARYRSLLARASVRIPDRRWQEVYNWVRINADWLVRDVPGLGRGLGGGLMEYPWWFGTETYSLQALMATGEFDLVEQTLSLLRRYSEKANGNGRIIHELTTNGGVFNPGNTQETAQFILTIEKLFQWTGDLELAREMYPAMTKGLEWLLTDMDQDGDLFPGGYGIMEVYGLNAELIDVAVYTLQALRATARIATVLNRPDEAQRYQELAARLEPRINQSFWIEEEGTYADFQGTTEQAVSATKGAIHQIRLKGEDKLTSRDRELIAHYERLGQRFAALPDQSRGWITNENWVIATPMEAGIAPRERAIRALDRIREGNVGEWGPFLSATEQQAMMTISTGVQAVAEANYGRTEEALWYVDRIVRTFNRVTPGSISEMMPDYGEFTIAWTSYGIVLPLIQHVFGIQPNALDKTVVFDPHLPAGWEDISIERLPIGTNLVSFSRARTARGVEYEIEAKDEGWTFVLKPKEGTGARYYLNGQPVQVTPAGIRMK